MPRLSKKLKDIWEIFIDPITGKRKYFTRCLGCARKCKQSFRVKEVDCPRYESKRAKEKKRHTKTDQVVHFSHNHCDYPECTVWDMDVCGESRHS